MLTGGREKLSKSEKNSRAIVRVGQSINLAVERFAAVGEAMADDNPEIKVDMYDACRDARTAGEYWGWALRHAFSRHSYTC